jgi:hypothetical protein
MHDQGLSERVSDLSIAESVEVAPIEVERPCVGAGATACTEIKDRHAVGCGPSLGLLEPRPITGRVTHQVSVEGKEADGNLAPPGVCQVLHAPEDVVPLGVRHPGYASLFGLPVRQQLGLVSKGVDLLPQQRIEAHMTDEQGPHLRGEALGSEVPLDIRYQRAVEVVHRDKHDGQIGPIAGNRLLEEPSRHRCRVAGLPRIDDLEFGASEDRQGGLRSGSNTLRVLHTPPKDGGVSHHRHAQLILSRGGGVEGAQAVCIGGDAKVVGLPQSSHGVCTQARLGLPSAHGIGLIGGLHTGESGADLSETQKGCSRGEAQEELGAKRWRSSGHWGQLIRVLLLFLLGSSVASAEVSLSLSVSVADGALRSSETGAITAHVQWLGEERVVPLSLTEPGIWSATVTGPQVRTVGIDLWLKDRVPSYRVSQGLEVLPKGDAELAWSLSGRGADAAWRLSEPIQLSEMRVNQERASMVWSAWLVLSVLVILLIGRRALEKQDSVVALPSLTGWMGLVIWVVFALCWTWPAALAGPDIVGRHFDAMGTVWVIDAANRLGLDLNDPFSAWPTGATYSAIDSWLLLPMAWIGSMLDPAMVHGWLGIIGVAATGWSAAAFARTVGATAPFHHLAGLLYVGSGIAAAALLEGHVYQVVNPWMPLMARSLWRCMDDEANWLDGVWAGVFFGLALFSSGYLGISAGLVAAFLGLTALVRGTRRLPVVLSALIAVICGLAYLKLFSAAGTPGATYATTETLRMGSLSLNSLGPANAELDRTDHSWSLSLSAASMALCVISLAFRARTLLPLFAVVVASILIALGPDWSLGIAPDEMSMASPIQFLWDIPWFRYLRFPGRIMWAGMLCISAMAAFGLSRLSARLGVRVALLVGAVLAIELIGTVRLPARQVVRSADVPGVYQVAEGAVFDLVGEGLSNSREVDSWMNAILCQYQTQHKRPIAEDCVAVGPDANPKVEKAREIAARLYEGDRPGVMALLQSWGFTALAVHLDWMDAADRLRLKAALQGMAIHTETDLAEGVAVVKVPKAAAVQQTPPSGASRLVGPPPSSFQWRMRVDLVVPEGFDAGRFFMIADPLFSAELKDNFGLPGDQFEDGIYSATATDQVSGEVKFRLTHVVAGQTTVLWSGPVVPLNLPEDRITFRITEDGKARPHLRAMEIFSPEVRNRGGKISGLSWLACLVMMGLWWLRFGRRRP